MHELGLQITGGVAYFGGALVTLDSPNAADGAVTGTVETNKELRSLLADGCGLEGQPVEVAEDGSFTVELGEDQSGQCQLELSATTGRPATTGTEQTVTWEFPVTVT